MTRTATDEVLLEMLRESTGTHFLDSGGERGRHWQQNRRRDLEAEAPAVVSFRWGEIHFTRRLYHWLRERVELDVDATAAFDGDFRKECDPDDDKSWEELREEFPSWYARHRSMLDTKEACPQCVESDSACDVCGGSGTLAFEDFYEARGIYGEGEPLTINSYNEESLLDQVVLFTYFVLRGADGSRGEQPLIVLQIHGGCDVRGGYSRPRVFRMRDDELAIFDFRTGAIVCAQDASHEWTTDDGAHWYLQGACGFKAGAQLESYEQKENADECSLESDGISNWTRGVLFVTEDGDGCCPLCCGPLEPV